MAAAAMLPAKTKCAHCSDPILFVQTPNGRRAPLDAEPDDDLGEVAVWGIHEPNYLLGIHVHDVDTRTAILNSGRKLYRWHGDRCRARRGRSLYSD